MSAARHPHLAHDGAVERLLAEARLLGVAGCRAGLRLLQLEVDLAEGDLGAGKRHRVVHPLAVDEGAVGRAQVAQPQPGLGEVQLGVTPRDGGIGDRHVAVGRAAHDQRAAGRDLDAEISGLGDELHVRVGLLEPLPLRYYRRGGSAAEQAPSAAGAAGEDGERV
jgi:hypothetical protein